MDAPIASRDEFGGVAVEDRDEFGGVALAAAPERDQFGGISVSTPTSNKLADAARRIPAGVQSGTGRTLAGAVRAGDIAATPTFIPFMGGLGPGAETVNRLNQQMPAVREEFVRGRPQRLAESTAFQLGREIEQAAAPTFGVDPARDNEFLAQLATAAGEMVPTLAAGAVAGPAGVAFQYGTSAGEAQAQEAIGAGKPEAADVAFLSAAGLGGITEAALGVPGRLLAIANRARKAGVNPGTFGRWANRNPMAAGIARAGAEGALREGAQEGLEQAGQNLIASDVAGYAPDRPVTEGVGRAMALGATLGGVIGGGSAGLNQAQRNERAALLRTLRDGRQVIVNEQTGTTDFLPLDVDELPAPPVAVPAPNLDPDPALQTLSPTPSAPTTATRGPTGAPAPVADVPRAGESLSPAAPSTFNLQPSTLPDVPGVPSPLQGQPYDTAMRTRPEATMETRPAAPLGLQREPTVSPELAEAIAAVRGGYNPEIDAAAPEPAPTVEQEQVKWERKGVKYAKRPDGSLKTKAEYTPDEWRAYTSSVIDAKLADSTSPTAPSPIPPDQSGSPTELTPPAKGNEEPKGSMSYGQHLAIALQDSGKLWPTVPKSLPKGFEKLANSAQFTRIAAAVNGFYGGQENTFLPVPGQPGVFQITTPSGKRLDTVVMQTQRGFYFGKPDRTAKLAATVKPAEVRPAEPGEQPQPPAQAAPAMQGGMDNLRFTSDPVAKGKGGAPDAKDAKAKLIAELEKAVAQSPFESQAEIQRLNTVLANPPEVAFKAVNSANMGEGFEARYRAEYEKAKQLLGRLGKNPKPVTIEIPGDGTFTVANTKQDLSEILAAAKRLQTATSSRWEGPNTARPRLAAREWIAKVEEDATRVYGMRRAIVKLREQAANMDLEIEPDQREQLRAAATNLESRLPERVAQQGLDRVRDQITEVRAQIAEAEAEQKAAKAEAKSLKDGTLKPRRGRSAQSQIEDRNRAADDAKRKLAQLNHRLKQLTEREAATQLELNKALAQANPAAVDSAIAALEAAKVKPGGLYALPDLGLTVTLWNGTLTAAQVALRATRSLAQAVQAGVDWLRAQGQAFDEAEVRKALEQGLLQAPGIREHVGKRLLQEDFSPAAKAALEPLLRYEVKPDAQLFAEAAAVVEAIGPMEAEANYFGNPWGLPADAHVVLGFAIGNGLSTLEAQARAAGETALADRIGRQNAEFQSQFVLQSTETARTLRAYRYFDLVGNLSPFTADLFARKVIERASQKQKQRIKPALDKGPDGEPGLTDRLNDINRTGIEEAARTPEVQGAARTAINQTIEEEAERKDTAVERAITLEVSNTLETLPSVVRKANAAVLGAWDKLSAGEQVRQQTGRAGQGLENSLWSAVKQRGGTVSTVSSVIAQVNRALHEQVNRALGITPQQFVNPTTYLMRLRDALGNAEVMSRIWEQTRAAVGANLAAIGEMEGLLVRIEAEIAELEAEAKTPLAGGPEVTARDAKLKAQQQAARDEMLKGRNANLAEAIKQRRARIADVSAQLAEYRKMQPAWQAVMGMTVDVWGPNLLRGLLREQMKADGFRLRKAVADHFRGLAGAPDPLQSLGVLRDKLIAASGLDPQAAERLAKDLEAEYTAQVNKERARLAERLAKTRELAKAKAAEREAKRPQLDAESLIDAYERRQTEWLKPTGRKSAVRAIVRQALREGAAVAGLNEQVVRGGVQAQLEAVGVPHEAAYRLAYEVWQERQAKGGGIEAVVAARVKELQLDLGRIIRQHWTQVDKAGESLAEHIVGETKMPAEQAERLATAIQRRFKALVQARKEQALRNLAKTPAARELQKPSVAQRIIEATNLGALDSEGLWQAVADKLGLPTYSDEASAEVKRLAERAQQLPEGSVQRQEATARLMRFIARQKGVNLGDLGWAFWYANTLSGPFTHAVNAFSNVLSLAGNVSTQFRDVRGIPQILAATAKGFRTGLTEARAIVKQGPGANRTKFTEQGQALENLNPQDFTGAGLVSQWRYVARALAAADAAFYFPAREAKAITLARALARQEGKTGAAIRTRAQQILDGTEEQQNLWGAQVDRERAQLVAMGEKPDALWTTRRLEQLREQGWGADIGEAADDFALRTTYNNRPYGLIGTLADVAKFAQNRVPGARGVVPFVNVVANVVNDSINYTPWGFARAYAAGRSGEPSVTLSLPFEWAEKLREGKSPMTPDAVVDLHAKAALGTAMVGSLMAMALAGLDDDDGENFQLYGSGPKDAAAKAALRETGWLPYSVRVNGTYVSFANTPLAIPLGALGHYLDAARYDKRFEQADAFNRLGVALWGGAHIITQQSFLDGLARLLGALEERRGRIDTASDRAVEQAFRSISSVAVPNALRQLDRLNDPKIYDARGIEGALVAAIPFARRAGSPALNAFGEPITNEPWKRFASDAEANVWTDLARRKIYPSVADKAKNANGREMTDDEHYRYVQESGRAIKRRLETPGMRQMIRSGKEEDARKAVTAIVREERERARRRLGF